jgi:hypothetical protein
MSDEPRTRHGYSKGRWMIERERCQIEEWKEPPPDSGGVDLASGVAAVLKRMGLANASWSAGIADEWPALVGRQVSQHTRPGALQGAELRVYADSSVWLSELQRYGMQTMLKNIQERFGANRVRKLRLQMDPDR